MRKYAKVIDNTTGLCNVGIGSDIDYYISLGYELKNVEQSEVDEQWYLANKCPHKSLADIKAEKYEENDYKASQARYCRGFTITIQEQECVFDTTQTTQTDLLTAFAVCSTGATYDGWVTNNGVELDLTLEDVALISATFKQKSNVYGKWNEYKTDIDRAQTIKELERIVIDYDL